LEGIKIEHSSDHIFITIDKNVVDLEYVQKFLEVLRLKYLVQKMTFDPQAQPDPEEEEILS
jgi:UDP-galactopyranose mutase